MKTSRLERRERPGHTLQTTALVNEVYLRLIDQTKVSGQNRAHFFGVAAHLMRQILVQHARRRQAAKRGGARPSVSLEDAVGLSQEPAVDLVALDQALTSLDALDPQKSRIVELRFFRLLRFGQPASVPVRRPIQFLKSETRAPGLYESEEQRA
ncbi:hypothetical protein HRbin08_00053 [bacterium HR08]|nr:hypothetical protein HRbin08_00053 [bacterium HR08]